MINRDSINQNKWVIFVLIITFVLVICFENVVFDESTTFLTQNTFLGLNLFLEILIFFVFSTFVVFGIKGYNEMFSQKFSNVIIFITGVMLTFVIFIFSYQIIFQE